MIKSVFLITSFLLISVLSLSACNSLKEEESNKRISDGVYMDNVTFSGLSEAEAVKKIERYAEGINILPQNAKMDSIKWTIASKEVAGKKVNVDNTLKQLLNAGEGKRLKPIIENITPGITVESLNKNLVQIGVYSTTLLDKSRSRTNNILLASEKLNYKKLMPGEEFSFNKVVGRRTEAKGYEEAPIIVKTSKGYKKDFETGGGVCQLTTTLYNAVDMCNMQITERHIHGTKVPYAPVREDATVYYGSIDFKFKNNRQYPVMITTYLKASSLTVKILENRN